MIGEVVICAREGCDVEFMKRTHNMLYHDDECTRLATNAKMMEKYYSKRARKLGLARYCKQCSTRLSRYNPEDICNSCLLRTEEGKNKELLDILSVVDWK